MQRRLVLEFTKMNGAGNDFIVIDNRFYHFSDDELADLARRFCPRRTGVGADGVLAFSRPTDDAYHFRMRYVNADGSVGTMCGNGARCLARFARQAGVLEDVMHFETDAGAYRAAVPAEPEAPVRLFVPPPRDWKPARRLATSGATPFEEIHSLWTGTEHAVCLVDSVDGAPVSTWGPALRYEPALAPAGANIDFVEVLREGGEGEAAALRVRTYEKGVEAETLACGTGALASALAARFLGRIQADAVDVHMPGGVLGVGFQLTDKTASDLFLEGPVESVYRGTLEV